MAFTAVTVTGTAKKPGGAVVPNAVVSFDLEGGMINSATEGVGTQTIAAADGTYSIVVSATDDAATTFVTGSKAEYHVQVVDPQTEERLEDFRTQVPHATTPTTMTALKALAD